MGSLKNFGIFNVFFHICWFFEFLMKFFFKSFDIFLAHYFKLLISLFFNSVGGRKMLPGLISM